MNEGFAYNRWVVGQWPESSGKLFRLQEEWARITPRDWWWCSGCYDWHWSPVSKVQL